MMLLYNFLWPLGLLVFLPGFIGKMVRRGGYRKDFGQRLGFYRPGVRQRLRKQQPVWIHAVSVGEVKIALKLAAQLREKRPDLHCALTTTTTTGHALAEKSSPAWMTVLYSPLDFLPVMHRAFSAIAPRQIVLIEAEVWPNMVSQAAKLKIPVALANARLSLRSERRFLRFRFLLAPIFQKLSLVCVPDASDGERWRRLGVAARRIHVVGNIKLDSSERRPSSGEPCRFLEQIAIEASQPVLLGGSTHRGEEAILMEAFLALRQEFPGLFLVIAPRHIERAEEIEALARARSLKITRRTRPAENSPDFLFLDTTGELADWYGIATIVFIGKSLTTHGGQNPAEAIVAGRPVIFGPHMENFAALANALLKNEGALCVRNANELVSISRRLLRDSASREKMVAKASAVLASHRGATQRTAALIDALS